MGMDFTKFSQPRQDDSSNNSLPQKVVDFVRALKEASTRLSYGGLTLISVEAGVPTSGLSVGQRGAGMAKQLPVELQSTICQAGGGYRTEKVPFPVTTELINLPVIPQKKAVAAFKEWEATE